VGGRLAAFQHGSHETHVRVDVTKKPLVARAEVVKPVLSVWSLDKSVLRALAVAGELDVAIEAVLRKSFFFVAPKLPLLRRIHKRGQWSLHDIAEPVLGIHEVVAGVEVAVVLKSHRGSAGFPKPAKASRHPDPTLKRDVEQLYKVFADILSNPLVEYGAEEISVGFGLHRPVCERPVLDRQNHLEKRGRFGGDSLHQRDKLHDHTADLLEKPVDFQGMILIFSIDHGQGVEFDIVLLQVIQTTHHLFEAGAAASVDSVVIVKLLRTVDGDTYQEVVLLEKLAPFVVQQHSVGLEGVLNALAAGVLFLELDHFAKIVDS
jgi:hypothetical protein